MAAAAAPCSSNSSTTSCPPWADLPEGVLYEIAALLLANIPDLLRFGAVCRSWKDAAAAASEENLRLPCRPSLPLLTFRDPKADAGDGHGGGGIGVSRYFYSLHDDRVYPRKVVNESRDWHCWGSSHGWLAMVDIQGGTFLFNPISGARVELPSLTTLPHIVKVVKRKRDGTMRFLYLDPIHMAGQKPESMSVERMQDKVPRKLALSSSPLKPDCIVMAIMSGMRTLVHTRPGEESWVNFPTQFIRYEDIMYSGGRFYAASEDEYTIAVDFRGGGGHGPGPGVELFAPELFRHKCNRRTIPDRMYVVTLPYGDFLQVVKYVRDGDPYWTESFGVFKLALGDKGKKKWVKQRSIGGYSLFLGFNHSMSLPATTDMGRYKANCIYFSDDNDLFYYKEPYGGHDFSIYNIGDKTIEYFCPIDSPRIMPSPIWITPSR